MHTNVFISYAREDERQKEWVQALAGALVGEQSVFVDQASIRAGKAWKHELATALARSSHFIVIWSSNAEASQWVRREIAGVAELASEQPHRRIISLCIDATPLCNHLQPYQSIRLDDSEPPAPASRERLELVLSSLAVAGLAAVLFGQHRVYVGLVALWVAIFAFRALRSTQSPWARRGARGKFLWCIEMSSSALAILLVGGAACALIGLAP